ncbi:hypothetical protein MGA5115_03004 [Marinomonas gallaica]|uniref:Uncharacterized protein n=1 Tax=Marinomonas gallaica TaxID=1806667 RepID=A0A1C3JUG3_9GAMM|nr:hypothetical protein [Marinomonas gallaica]SBT18843.1 hypothetical protein MGA5115_03004 [Marinomonas gallaica]SBT21798.1 hypothetical protein MGA5116_02408 [Marinomonas gallaica]
MNKRELSNGLVALRNLLSNESLPVIYDAIDIFSSISNMVQYQSNNILQEGTTSQNVRSKTLVAINQAILEEKKLRYRKVISESTKIEDGISYFKSNFDNNGIYLDSLLSELNQFLDLYEEHTRQYSPSTFLSIALCASKLKVSIDTVKNSLDFILSIYDSGYLEKSYEGGRLDLYLSNVNSLKSYAQKLNSIQDIYDEILHLQGLSTSDYPLLIEHLENGSLWVKVLGHTLTATLLTSVLTLATEYYQNEFTKTGQLNQLPSSVKVAEGLLNLSEQLKENGIDTTEIDQNIESSTRKISRKLDELLSDQPTVYINDKKCSLVESMSQSLIEQSKVLNLEKVNQDTHLKK